MCIQGTPDEIKDEAETEEEHLLEHSFERINNTINIFLKEFVELRALAINYEVEALGRREWLDKIAALLFPDNEGPLHMNEFIAKITELVAFKAAAEAKEKVW